jgi:S1-C subfamily serine protease
LACAPFVFLKTESERKTIDWEYWQNLMQEDERFSELPYLDSFFSRTSINAPISLDRLLDATVTVFVDKGILLQNGVSYPDNVIGSGFFIDRQGHFLTNYHVIQSEVDPEYEGFSRAYIRLRENNGQKIPVKVIGWDPEFDLALVKAPVDNDSFIPMSYWSNASLGDTVKALGSPLGLEATITSGVVSNVERSNFSTGFRLQVDAPVNPGNSGGPLVNESGRERRCDLCRGSAFSRSEFRYSLRITFIGSFRASTKGRRSSISAWVFRSSRMIGIL